MSRENEIIIMIDEELKEYEVEVLFKDDKEEWVYNSKSEGIYSVEKEALLKVQELIDSNSKLWFDKEAYEMNKIEKISESNRDEKKKKKSKSNKKMK